MLRIWSQIRGIISTLTLYSSVILELFLKKDLFIYLIENMSKRGRGGGRERILSRISALTMEPNVGLDLTVLRW